MVPCVNASVLQEAPVHDVFSTRDLSRGSTVHELTPAPTVMQVPHTRERVAHLTWFRIALYPRDS